jgi:hypothetical protein
MYSLYPFDFVQKENFVPSFIAEKDKKKIQSYLNTIQFFAKNAELACKAFSKASGFDPLVKDGSCQLHADHLLVLFREPEVNKEIIKLANRVQTVLQTVNRLKSTLVRHDKELSFKQLVTDFDLMVEVSEQVQIICFAHLLTLACCYRMSPSGEVIDSTDYYKVRAKLAKDLDIETIKETVRIARETLSLGSTLHIQGAAAQLKKMDEQEKGLLMRRLSFVKTFKMDDGDTPAVLRATSAFYNVKALMQEASEDQRVIEVREDRSDKQEPLRLFYRSREAGGPFSQIQAIDIPVGEPIMVIEGHIPKGASADQIAGAIAKDSLMEVILANAALSKQYTIDDDLSELDVDAQKEIALYRERAQNMNLSVTHVYPTVFQHGPLCRQSFVKASD